MTASHRYFACVTAVTLALTLSACGGSEGDAPEVSEAALTLGPACDEAMVSWPAGTALDQGTCSGPWEYKAYSVNPCYASGTGPVCGIAGYEQKTCHTYETCRNQAFGVERFGDVVRSGLTITPTCTSERDCCVWPDCFKPVCETITTCDYASKCQALALTEKNSYPPEYRAGITITGVTTNYTTYGNPGTCGYTLKNAPIWNAKADYPCPETGSYSCDDTTRPIYKTCRHSSFGNDQNPAACGLTPLKYSEPGKTYAQVQQLDPAAARTDLHRPVCTTYEDLPMGTAAEVQDKYQKLNLGPPAGAVARDSLLSQKLAKNRKLVFELRGDLLSPSQTLFDNAIWQYQGWNHVRPACGSWRTRGPETTVTLPQGFESATTPFSGWAVSPAATSASAPAGQGYTGTYAAQVGPASSTTEVNAFIGRVFWPPSTGGTLSFWWRGACVDAVNDWAEATMYDYTLERWVTLLPRTCVNDGVWKQVVYDLGPHAGHRLYLNLKNHDDAVAGTASYTLYDDVVFPETPGDVDGALDMCDRVTQAPPTVADALAAKCVAYIGSARGLSSGYAAKQGYVDTANALALGVMDRGFSQLTVSGVPAGSETADQRVATHARRLGIIQSWWDQTNSGVYTGTDAAAKRAAGASLAVGALWKGASGRAESALDGVLKNPASSEAAVKSALDAFFGDELRGDREVLRAAFPTAVGVTPPLTRAPLLLVVGDALRTMSDRLVEADVYHDLGCRFRTCDATTRATEVSQLHALLGSLADQTELGNAVNAATLVHLDPVARDDWKDVFARIQQTHPTILQAAVKNATSASVYSRSTLEAATGATPVTAVGLASIVSEHRKRTQEYEKAGFFVADAKDTLAIGLTESRWNAVRQLTLDRVAALRAAVSTYRGARAQLAATLLAERGNAQNQDGIKVALLAKAKTVEDLSQDLITLRIEDSLAAARFADMGKAYDKYLALIPSLSAFYTPPVKQQQIPVSAANARYTGSLLLNVPNINVVGFEKLTARKGDLITAAVTGSWSPTCAMRTQGSVYGLPIKRPGGSDVFGAVAGPEGYYLQAAENRFEANQTSTTISAGAHLDMGMSHRSCVGVRAEASVGGGFGPVSTSVSAYSYTETCGYVDAGVSFTATESGVESGGSESRNSASFALGLRLLNTPFPRFPVGSLLVVQMRPGQTAPSQILDVQVVQRESTIHVVDDADVYLVVNDRLGCTNDTSALSVTITQRRPYAGNLAEKLGTDMVNAAVAVKTQAKLLGAQGRLLPQQLSTIRGAAFLELGKACQCQARATYPPEMIAFFENYVDAELARAERQVELRSIARQTDAAILDIKATRDDLAATQTQGRYLRQVALWSLRSMDGREVRARARDLADVVTRYFEPFVKLRYPTSTASTFQLDDLIAIDWTGPVDVAAETAASAVEDVVLDADTVVATSPALGVTQVAVAFPNPVSPGYAPIWKEADPARAMTIWNQMAIGDAVSIEIRPEDIYQRDFGTANLLCTQALPVVKSMGLFVARPSSTETENPLLNELDRYTVLYPNPEMTFVVDPAGVHLRFVQPDWLVPRMPIVYGLINKALTMFHSAPSFNPASTRGVGAGLSPVNSYDLPAGIGSMLDPYGDAEALVVVFDLESRSVAGQTLGWVDTCK